MSTLCVTEPCDDGHVVLVRSTPKSRLREAIILGGVKFKIRLTI